MQQHKDLRGGVERRRAMDAMNAVKASRRSATKAVNDVFASLLRRANAAVDVVFAGVDPKVAMRATQATEAVRSALHKAVEPASGAAQLVQEALRELLPRSGSQRAYSKRDKMKAMKAKMAADGVEVSQAAARTPLGAPTSDETAVTIVRKKESAWKRRVREMTERLEKVPVFRSVRDAVEGARRAVTASKAYRKGADVGGKVGDAVEELRDQYETTQNPVVWAVRDTADHVFAETDAAAALAEIRRIDADFALDAFMEEMEEYMIPKFVKAYLQADIATLRQACEGDALRAMVATFQQRSTLGHIYDDRILDVSAVNFGGATMLENSEPVLLLTFMCQHVHCVKDLHQNIVEGSDHEIRSTFYSLALRRDLDNQDFNWRVLEFSVQGITALI